MANILFLQLCIFKLLKFLIKEYCESHKLRQANTLNINLCVIELKINFVFCL